MPIDSKNDDELPPESLAWFKSFARPRPKPMNYATAEAHDPEEFTDEDRPKTPDEAGYYQANVEYEPHCWTDFDVTAEEHRIITQYMAARGRQEDAEKAAAAARWNPPPPPPPPREPEPEAIPPGGALTPRQEDFCRHYVAQPVATRAAVLAGYAEDSAHNQGWRLLKNPLILDRIATLRVERGVPYTLQRDTVQDKLEAVFFGALDDRNHAAAVAALKLQAMLGGLFARATAARAAPAGAPPRKARIPRAKSPNAKRRAKRRKMRRSMRRNGEE